MGLDVFCWARGRLQLYIKVNILNYIIFKRSKEYPNMNNKPEQQQIFQVVLSIAFVKMKVKFPCKMVIQHSGHSITNDVPPNSEGKFVFNQEIKLKQQHKNLYFELNVCLITDKRARYISGTAKIFHNELIRSQGDRLVITLSKCLDTEAFCQLRVQRVIRENQGKKTVALKVQKNYKAGTMRLTEQSTFNNLQARIPRRPDAILSNQTKSESYFPVTNPNLKQKKQQQDYKKRQYMSPNLFNHQKRPSNHSPKSRTKFSINSKNKIQQLQNNQIQRNKIIQAEVYKDNYQKIKQKYIRWAQISQSQLNKRLMLQNNQNTYKLQIVKLKIKNDQLQKVLTEKNIKLKEVCTTLAYLKGLESEVNILRSDVSNKQHAIHIMQQTIISLSKENDELRLSNKGIGYKLEQQIHNLQSQLQSVTLKARTKQQDLERDIKMLSETLQYKERELQRRNELIQKEKYNIYDLQKNIQNKIFQYDTLLQNQKHNFKQKLQQNKAKIQELNQIIIKMTNQKTQSSSQIQKLKGIVLRAEYETKLYNQQISDFKIQIEELKEYRNKYNDALKQFKIISQQKIYIQKNSQKIVYSKEKLIQEMTLQYKKEIQFLRKNNKQLDQKYKATNNKLLEFQGQNEYLKNNYEKTRKSHENLNKQYLENKEKQKGIKKNRKALEEQFQQNKKQFTRYKQKNNVINQNLKTQINKLKEQLSKTLIQLHGQTGKSEHLAEANSELSIQLARLKMSHQFNQDKYDKMMQSSQQKYANYEHLIKEHQNIIERLQQKLHILKNNQKEYLNKLYKCDSQLNIIIQKNEKILRDYKLLQQKQKNLESNMKDRLSQLNQKEKKIDQYDNKVYKLQDKCNKNQGQLNFMKSQEEKLKKMLLILQKDLQQYKTQSASLTKKLFGKQNELIISLESQKKLKEQLKEQQQKNINISKESIKFRQELSEAFSNSFNQFIYAFNKQKIQNNFPKDKLDYVHFSKDKNDSNKNNYNLLELNRKNIIDINNDMVNAINLLGKQNKNHLFKLEEKTKNLQKELEITRIEAHKYQEISKKQLHEKKYLGVQYEQQIKNLKFQAKKRQQEFIGQVRQLQQEVNHLKSQTDMLLGLKMELEFNLTKNKQQAKQFIHELQKKLSQSQFQKSKIQQKLQYEYNNNEKMQKKVYELEIDIMNINTIIINEKQSSYKKDMKIDQYLKDLALKQSEMDELKKKLKKVNEEMNQYEIKQHTLIELNEKYMKMLNEQEGKLKDVRTFNNNIIKQKEQIIKKQLQKCNEVYNLQNENNTLKYQVLQYAENIKKNKQEIQDYKDEIKKYNEQIKLLQNVISQEKVKYNQIRDKLRQKEQNMNILKEQTSITKIKSEETISKLKHIIEQLKQEYSLLIKQTESSTKQSNQTIRSLESQVHKLTHQLQTSKDEMGQLQEALYVERQNQQAIRQSLNRQKLETQENKHKIQELQKMNDELNQQNRFKDEQMFEISAKIYQYETRMQELQVQKQNSLQQLNNNFNIKYDEDYQEIYQKIQFIEKEKNYLKQKYDEKEQELNKKKQQLKFKQIEQIQFKKIYQYKIRKLQEQKLNIFSQKNKEINKLIEENKLLYENVRLKEVDNRKIVHQLEISRSTIQKLQNKLKEIQSEKNIQVKAYQIEIQNLRKKQLVYKSFKDIISNNQWNCEREVRKNIQSFIKKMLQIGQKDLKNENFISYVKSLQEGILSSISTISKEQ